MFYNVEEHLFVFKYQINSILKHSLPKIVPQRELHVHLDKHCIKHLHKLISH